MSNELNEFCCTCSYFSVHKREGRKKVYSYKISMFKINGKIVSTFRSPFLNKLSDFANVFKAFMGCGYLVMPFAFKQSGLIVSKLYSLSTEVTKPI